MTRDPESNLRIRLDSELKTEFDDFTRRKKISQVDAITSMLSWLLAQDDMLQSIVVGQIEPSSHAEVAALICQRMKDQRSVYDAQGGDEKIPGRTASSKLQTDGGSRRGRKTG